MRYGSNHNDLGGFGQRKDGVKSVFEKASTADGNKRFRLSPAEPGATARRHNDDRESRRASSGLGHERKT
jgi:hypothetical protein